MSIALRISRVEEEPRIRWGYVCGDGVVRCGECVQRDVYDLLTYSTLSANTDDLRYAPVEKFNPGEGDDWCSDCDKPINGAHQ